MPIDHLMNLTQSVPRAAARLLGMCLALSLIGCATTSGDTHLLLMGGGSEPKSNQISLEKNILYFHRVIGRLDLKDAHRDVLFANGDDPAQDDVQYLADASDAPQAMRMIDVLMGPGRSRSKTYRPHDIGGGEIETSPENINSWFDTHAQEVGPDDRVLVYFTGHGSKGPKENKQNTSLRLWSKKAMRVQPFVGNLDKLDKQTPVVLVMVQCFSGGFANVIFNEGDPAKGLSDHNRCGFFASVHDRPAAGCTPHVNEADYKEYSSYFWAALSGEDRLGEPVDRPDYNGDGQTSYLEAHAFALIHSDSIDLSMSTSDRLVRAVPLGADDDEPGRLTDESGYKDLLAAADPARRAVLEGLSARLNLSGEDRKAKAQAIVDENKKERDRLKKEIGLVVKTYNAQRKPLIEKLKGRWPVLADRKKHDEARAKIVEEHHAINEIICEQDAYAKAIEQLDKIQSLKDRREQLSTAIAHAERFVYTCQTIANIDTLKRFGDPQHIDAYNQLFAREMEKPGS